MFTTEKTQQLEQRLAELIDFRAELSKEIHLIKCKLRQAREHNRNSESIVFKMFGKRISELTADEMRLYWQETNKPQNAKRKAERLKKRKTLKNSKKS